MATSSKSPRAKRGNIPPLMDKLQETRTEPGTSAGLVLCMLIAVVAEVRVFSGISGGS